MRITVESAGFTEATDACRATNEIAAMVTESLAGKLAGYGGMAGNDATSLTFAGSYDDAAHQALATLTELTHAFIGLGRLIEATGANHRAAEEASTAGRRTSTSRHDTTEAYVRVTPTDPPSCLGGQEPSLGPIDEWILDHVEGFVWPGADTSMLYDAATTWRSAASSIEHLDHHLDTIADLLARQRSPEIPIALDVLDNVRAMISDTAAHLTDLGQACEDYATAVEEARDRTRALLAEIGQMIIEGAAFSVLATAITGGLGGGAAATAAITRITAKAPRFHAILTALRTVATTAATRARTARDGLRDIRTRAEKLARIPARTEHGTMKNPLGWGGVGSAAPGRHVPDVADQKLKNYVDQLFKGVAHDRRIGDGTTMDAIRHELATGELVHGKDHVRKGREVLRGLDRWLRKNGAASPSDRQVAQTLRDELQELLHP